MRTELEPAQASGFIQILDEPYSTLVMLFGLSGRRQEEGLAIKPTDLGDDNALHIRRVIVNGRVEELEENEQQVVPLDQPKHAELVRRLRVLGEGHEWIFHSRKGTPLNPGNARRRHLHPAAKALGIKVGGTILPHLDSEDAERRSASGCCKCGGRAQACRACT